jgi:RsiW-degrading membrane proteinase PrsW (M82 family)
MRTIRPSKKIVWTIAGVSAAVWLYIGIVLILIGHNKAVIPVWMIFGSFTLAAAFLTVFIRRLGSGTTLTPRFLLLAFLAGGLGSILIGGSFDTLTINLLGRPTGLLLAGVVEEAAKAILVVIICWRLPDKTIRNGLIVGGTVGLGFGAFEDLGYALTPFIGHAFTSHDVLMSARTQLFRVLVGPVGHPLWSALLSAAIFAAARNGKFRPNIGVIAAYLGVALSHGMWDGAPGAAQTLTGHTWGQALGWLVGIGLVVWATLWWRRIAKRAGADYRAHLTPDVTQLPQAPVESDAAMSQDLPDGTSPRPLATT